MAILVAGLLFLSAATNEPAPELSAAAEQAGVDVSDLEGALLTVGESDPIRYLRHAGHLPWPAPSLNLAIERRLDCIQRYESGGVASAVNRRSGASGAFQFLPSTWRTTPQGRAGLSVFDPVAAREAARWMLGQGRAREWVPVQMGLC